MRQILVLLLFSVSIISKGQDNQSRASFGIRGGFGYANITNPGSFSGRFSYKQHVQLGIYTEVKITQPLYLQAELLFSNPGIRLYEIDSKGYKVRDSIFNFNCIQLPLQAKLKVGNDVVKGYYMIGVAPSYLINANLKYKIDSTSTTFFDYTPYENRFTFNMTNTIGVEVDIDEWIVPFIDFRYMQGLTNVHKSRALRPETNLQFILSAGVRF